MSSINKHFLLALSQYGFQEVTGKQDNPEILKYFNDLGFDGSKLHDETAWCAAFANWCLKNSEMEYQNTLTARSFLKLGEDVKAGEEQVGDVVVFHRGEPDSWMGHVGFYVRKDERFIWVLGGNQSNQVKISAYPVNRLLGVKRYGCKK